MRRVLVTGASGFIGRHVVPALLARGCEVHTVGRRASSVQGVTHHTADLLSWHGAVPALAASRADTVIHLAWFVDHGRFWTAPENLDWVAATLRLARAAAAAGVGRFVGVGTCAEYDWSHEPGRPRREDDPLAATSLYGEAKGTTGRLLTQAFAGSPMTVAWARLFFPFGPGEPPGKLVPSLVAAMRAGTTFALRNAPLVRDFVPVADAGDAIAALSLSSMAGPLNIGSGEALAIIDFAKLVRRVAGSRGEIIVPQGPASTEPPLMAADIGRLRKEVGWTASSSLDERIRQML